MRLLLLLLCGALPACAGASSGKEPAAPTGPLTESECEAFLDHVLDLQLDRWRAERPAEEIPAPEQIAALRSRLKEEEMDSCLALPRPDYRCAMEAASVEEVRACETAP